VRGTTTTSLFWQYFLLSSGTSIQEYVVIFYQRTWKAKCPAENNYEVYAEKLKGLEGEGFLEGNGCAEKQIM
jgi:hypothetical protein